MTVRIAALSIAVASSFLAACAGPADSTHGAAAQARSANDVAVGGDRAHVASAEKDRIAAVLDDWHDAAARADESRYFAHFAAGGVFLGTDITERWDVAAFRVYAHPHFAKGKAWSFRAVRRVTTVLGDAAWFDEDLATEKMGPARGSGVLVRVAGAWKIVQYNLSVPIPNDRFKAVKAVIDGPAPGDAAPVTPAPAPRAPAPPAPAPPASRP